MDTNNKPKKAWYKRFWVWLSIIILFGIVVGAAGGGNKSTNTATDSSNAPQTGSTKPEEKKTEYKVGEAATMDNRTITVTNVQRNYSTGNEYARPEAGKEFVVVTVEIANNGKDSLSYNTFDFKMQDTNGVQQSESIMALSTGKLNSGSLAPGGKVTGKLAYEVPAGDSGLKLLFDNFSFFGGTVLTFKL